MKILLICSSSQNIYNFRIPMIKKFEEKGFEVFTAAFDDEYKDELIAKNVKLFKIKDSNRSINPFKIFLLTSKFKKLYKLINPDYVFTFMLKPNTFGVFGAKKCGIKNIFSMVEGAGQAFSSNGVKWKIIKKIECFLYKKASRYMKKVFFLNHDDINEFIDLKLVKKEQCILLNGIGVDLEDFPYKNQIEEKSFLMMSRLLKQKGVLEYCMAAEIVKKSYPESKFVLLGAEGDITKKDLEFYIENKIIEYFGNVKNVKPYLYNSSCVILPSYYREGLPMVLMEAQSSGRAVITTDNVGCRDTVIDGFNGFLVKKRDAIDLSEKIMNFISNDNAQDMGKNARQYAEEHYDQEIINKKIINEII